MSLRRVRVVETRSVEVYVRDGDDETLESRALALARLRLDSDSGVEVDVLVEFPDEVSYAAPGLPAAGPPPGVFEPGDGQTYVQKS